MASTRVLISYARADGSDLARRTRDLLNRAKNDPWLDVEDIAIGTEWEPSLMAAITKTDVLIVIITPGATQSQWVQKEVEYALSIQKRTVALKYDPAPPPAWLGPVQFIDNPGADEAKTLAQVVGVLDAVWDDVRRKLSELTDEADDRFADLVAKLRLLVEKRAKLRPEGVLASAEILERASSDLRRPMPLADVVEKVRTEAYLRERLAMERAYQAHKSVILPLFTDAMNALPLPPMEIVSVVCAVMTKAEADELVAPDAFDATTEELREHFTAVRRTIEQDVRIVDWAQRYGDKPEDWRPFAPDGPTLAAILTEELRQLSEDKLLYRPKFVDVRTLNDAVNRAELKALRKGRCVVVMDVLSICHPSLFDAYRRTLLDVFPQTLVVKVAPAASVAALSESERALRLRQRMDVHFHDRYYDKDPLCVIAGREVELRRELVRIAPAPSDQGIRSAYRDGR